jgi:hypothetical protein
VQSGEILEEIILNDHQPRSILCKVLVSQTWISRHDDLNLRSRLTSESLSRESLKKRKASDERAAGPREDNESIGLRTTPTQLQEVEDTAPSSGSKVVGALGDATPHPGRVIHPIRELAVVLTSMGTEMETSHLDVRDGKMDEQVPSSKAARLSNLQSRHHSLVMIGIVASTLRLQVDTSKRV